MRIKLTKEQQELLSSMGSVVKTEKAVYQYLPFWYKETEDEDVFEQFTFQKLPDDLVKTIEFYRAKPLDNK